MITMSDDGIIFKGEMNYKYSPEQAIAYSRLEIAGTTYEISFNEMSRLGDFQEKIILDFGTGTGRTAYLLKSLGAKKVIGVDQDENMIAQTYSGEGIEFYLIANNSIPLPDASVDAAVSAHVFVEMRTIEEMQQAVKEIARVLVPSGIFFLITTNPASSGCEYKSYRYEKIDKLKCGDQIICIVKTDPPFAITDTYWTVDVYYQVLLSAGFTPVQTALPLADDGGEWCDETDVAPDIIFVSIKISS
jgi:ubiquinone/menaquinone biosynthesis C-methylase UbiE